MPSAVLRHPDRRPRSFLIEEILRPDFGRRRSTATTPDPRRQKPFPVDVGANHVTNSIWQPFATSPSRPVADNATCGGTAACRTSNVDRMKKSARRKSRVRPVESTDCGAAAQSRKFVSVARQSSSRSSSSSASSGTGSDVSATSSTSTESSTDAVSVAPSGTITESRSTLHGQFALPAWVYCTRYSDRPSSGIGLYIEILIHKLLV